MFNLDEKHFPDPMTVDFDRPRVPNASFGIGIHFCIGAPLARLELRLFLEEWLKRIPDFRVKAGTAIQLRTGITMAYQQLPIEWN